MDHRYRSSSEVGGGTVNSPGNGSLLLCAFPAIKRHQKMGEGKKNFKMKGDDFLENNAWVPDSLWGYKGGQTRALANSTRRGSDSKTQRMRKRTTSHIESSKERTVVGERVEKELKRGKGGVHAKSGRK